MDAINQALAALNGASRHERGAIMDGGLQGSPARGTGLHHLDCAFQSWGRRATLAKMAMNNRWNYLIILLACVFIANGCALFYRNNDIGFNILIPIQCLQSGDAALVVTAIEIKGNSAVEQCVERIVMHRTVQCDGHRTEYGVLLDKKLACSDRCLLITDLLGDGESTRSYNFLAVNNEFTLELPLLSLH